MTNRTTQAVLKELESMIEDSNVDLMSKPAEVRNGYGMQKNDAILAIPALKKEYGEKVFQNVVFFFPVGTESKAAAFAVVAAMEGGLAVASVDAPYHQLSDSISRVLGNNREFSVHALVALNAAIEDLTEGSDKNFAVPPGALTSLESTPTPEALVKYVSALIESVHGTGLVDFCVSKILLDQALKSSFSGKTFGAVVLGTDDATRKSLTALAASSKVLVVDVDTIKDMNKDSVLDVLKKMSPKKDIKVRGSLSTSTETPTI